MGRRRLPGAGVLVGGIGLRETRCPTPAPVVDKGCDALAVLID